MGTDIETTIIKFFSILGIIAILGNLLDMGTTFIALQNPDNREANVIMDFVIKELGWLSFFLIKIGFCFFFLPFRYSLINWALAYTFKTQYAWVKKTNIALLAAVHFSTIYWFWYLGLTNLTHIF